MTDETKALIKILNHLLDLQPNPPNVRVAISSKLQDDIDDLVAKGQGCIEERVALQEVANALGIATVT